MFVFEVIFEVDVGFWVCFVCFCLFFLIRFLFLFWRFGGFIEIIVLFEEVRFEFNL